MRDLRRRLWEGAWKIVDGKFVFKIKDDNTIERIAVSPGVPVGAWVTVGTERSAGDRIITRGNERVSPGQSVEPEVLEY